MFWCATRCSEFADVCVYVGRRAGQHQRARAAAVATAATAIVAAAMLCAPPASCLGDACHCVWMLAGAGGRGVCVVDAVSGWLWECPQAAACWGRVVVNVPSCSWSVVSCRLGMAWQEVCPAWHCWGAKRTFLRLDGVAVRAPGLAACRLCRGVLLVVLVQQVLFRSCASVC